MEERGGGGSEDGGGSSRSRCDVVVPATLFCLQSSSQSVAVESGATEVFKANELLATSSPKDVPTLKRRMPVGADGSDDETGDDSKGEPEKKKVVKDDFKENLANVIGKRADKELAKKTARYDALQEEKLEHEKALEKLVENSETSDNLQVRLATAYSSKKAKICSKISAIREQVEKLEDRVEQLIQEKNDNAASYEATEKDVKLQAKKNEEAMTAEKEKLAAIDLETRILLLSERRRQEIACVRAAAARLEERLRCPVCLETAGRPIYKCDEDHLVCGKCRDRLSKCPECRSWYRHQEKRHRWAERDADELRQLEKRIKRLAEGGDVEEEAEEDTEEEEDVAVLDDTIELIMPTFGNWKHEAIYRLIGRSQAEPPHELGVSVGWMLEKVKYEMSKRDLETSLRFLCEQGKAYSTIDENTFKIKF